jgi:hypothetical protein
MNDREQVTIFYSWQSTINPERTRLPIENAIKNTISEIKGFNLKIDEATRNTAGAPNLAEDIISKIANCDIFICDITMINGLDKEAVKKTPNPNVLFELGYARAHLGFDRICLLFNGDFGEVNDLPFDLDRKIVSIFNFDPENGDQADNLKKIILNKIYTIIKTNPPRIIPKGYEGVEFTKRKKDIEKLNYFFSLITTIQIDHFLEEFPSSFYWTIFEPLELINGYINTSAFIFYDKRLNELKPIIEGLYHLLDYSDYYKLVGEKQIFSPTIYQNDTASNILDKLEKDSHRLGIRFKKIVNYIHRTYPEVQLG